MSQLRNLSPESAVEILEINGASSTALHLTNSVDSNIHNIHTSTFEAIPRIAIFFGGIGTSQGLSQDFSPMLRHQHGVLPLRTPITILRKDCPTIFQGIRNFGTSFLRVLKGSVWKNTWK